MKRAYAWPTVLAALLVLLGVTARAQESGAPGGEAEEDERPFSMITLTLRVDGAGKREVNLWKFSSPVSAPVEGLKEALAEGLGCSLVDLPVTQQLEYWQMRAVCSEELQREEGVLRGEMALGPLLAAAGKLNVENLAMGVEPAEFGEMQCEPVIKLNLRGQELELSCSYSWVLGKEKPPEKVTFVLREASGRGVLGPLGAVLAAPILLTLWLRRRALRARNVERAAIWFGYWRSLNWITLGTVVAWWMALEMVEATAWLARYQELAPLLQLNTVMFLLPPMVVAVVCQWLSYPVHLKVRKSAVTKQEIWREGVWSLAASTVPLLMLIDGIASLVGGNGLGGVAWLGGALAVRGYAKQKLIGVHGMTPHAVTTGELRDRVFGLAEKLGVKLQQLYVMPVGRTRLANAFAVMGNTVILTDYLLGRLSKREVDAVVAHELAHLKLKHPSKIAGAYLLGLALAGVLWSGLWVVSLFAAFFVQWLPIQVMSAGHYVLLVGCPLLTTYFFSRRFEYAADRQAAQLTGDAEAMITALVKISRLNLMPIHWGRWDEKLLTHPSMRRRAESIAREAGLPVEQVPEILRGALETGEQYDQVPEPPGDPGTGGAQYVLPAATAGEGKAYSTLFKSQITLRIIFGYLLALVAPAAAVVWLVRKAGWESGHWWFYLGGLLLTIGVVMLHNAYVAPQWGSRELRKKLEEKAKRAGLDPAAGVLAGLAPAAAPRMYESQLTWDAGWLYWDADRLVFWGEEAKFLLRREQVTEVRLVRGAPGWQSNLVPRLRWRAGEQAEGSFLLYVMAAGHAYQSARRGRELGERLCDWWTKASGGTLPGELTKLGPPELGAVTGVAMGDLVRRDKMVSLMAPAVIAAILAALALGLPLGFFDALAAAAMAESGQPLDVSGWWVVGLALATRIIQLIPFWRWKEPTE